MPEEVSLDDLVEELGRCGPYQVRLYSLILVGIVFNAIYNAQYVFNAADVKYRCVVPECETSPPQWSAGEWSSWTLVDDDRCHRRPPIAANCSRHSFDQNSTQRCDSWLYESKNTIVAEFDLACQDWKRTLVGTVHSIGVFTALLFIGIVSDSIGRRTTFIMTATTVAVAGMARSFSNSYEVYLVLEYIDALLGSGVYSTGFVLALEMVKRDMRVFCGSLISSAFAVGQVVLALVAWAVPYWRTFTRVIYAPSFIFLLYFFVLHESVRWLLARGKEEKAKQILMKVAQYNKTQLSEDMLRRLAATPDKKQEEEKPRLLRQLLRSRILLTRVAVCSFCWMTITFVYYGLSINSVSLAGSMHLNYILTSLVEIPGYIASVLTLDRFGRKKSIMAALIICGISLIILPMIPKVLAPTMLLSSFGKLCVSAAFSALYVYTSELFPTMLRHRIMAFCSMVARLGQVVAMFTPLLVRYGVLVLCMTLGSKCCVSGAFVAVYIFTMELVPTNARHSLMNVCSTVGRIGSMTAPMSPLLMRVRPWLPYVVFGTMSVCAALLLLLTPETLRTRLPDTVSQAEMLAGAPDSDAPAAPAAPRRPHTPGRGGPVISRSTATLPSPDETSPPSDRAS